MSDAWFCPDPNGHIQAIGYDDKGRKQYRYHPDFRAKQERSQISTARRTSARRCRKLRKRVEADLKGKRDLAATRSSRRSSACSTRPISASATRPMREDNKSFGATTLRNRHAKVSGRHGEDALQGEERHRARAHDHRPSLARIVQALPGSARPASVPISRRRRRARMPSPRPTSTPISARRRATISPPSISAPGARARSPSSRSAAPARTGDRPRRRCSSRSPRRSATRRRSAANPMSIPA